MIQGKEWPVEPWAVRERELDLDLLARSESLFALSNGHIGLRGNLDEGEPYGIPGSYLNAVYEVRSLPYAEPAYGDPKVGQTVVNVTNGKLIRLLVDDEPFDVRYGRLLEHERLLDLRAGMLTRRAVWESPAGRRVRVRSRRLVSFTQRAVTAAEVGQLELAYDYACEAAQIDLHDTEHNSSDGLHIASLAGVWTALVAGFGGLREREGTLSFAPQLPDRIGRLRFTLRWRGQLLDVDIEPGQATYTLHEGTNDSLAFRHDGKDVTVTTATPLTEPISKRLPMLPRPPQPPGRGPAYPKESGAWDSG